MVNSSRRTGSKRCGQGSHHIYNKLTGPFVYTEGTVLCWRPDTVADFVAAARRKEPSEQQTRINIFKQILMLIGVWLIWPLVGVESSLLVCIGFIKEYTCALNLKVEILLEFRKKPSESLQAYGVKKRGPVQQHADLCFAILFPPSSKA